MEDINEKAQKLFSEIRPLFDNIDPKLTNISTEELLKSAKITQSLAWEPSKKTLQQAQEFYEQAKNDLHSSKLLYDGEEFGNSVYFFQQCVEKACKAYGLRTGLIKNVRKISHESSLIFIEICKNALLKNNIIGMLENYTGDKESEKIANAEKLIKSDE